MLIDYCNYLPIGNESGLELSMWGVIKGLVF